jgi:hypothetical protein
MLNLFSTNLVAGRILRFGWTEDAIAFMLDDDFEEDYPVLKGQSERILDGLVFALSASATDAVIVTSVGVKEHAAADF